MIRIGIGQDSHSFAKISESREKPLILGGVVIKNHIALQANSDGDVIVHSLCNALSSAIGGDSLGTWADEMCLKKGIKDSSQYLKHIFNLVKKKMYQIENIAISIEAKRPYLALSVICEIKKQLAQFLEITIDQIGITITSGENLTVFGKGEGIHVLTIVCLKKND